MPIPERSLVRVSDQPRPGPVRAAIRQFAHLFHDKQIHQKLDSRKVPVSTAALEMIYDPTRRCNHHMGPSFKFKGLRNHVHPPYNDGSAYTNCRTENGKLF